MLERLRCIWAKQVNQERNKEEGDKGVSGETTGRWLYLSAPESLDPGGQRAITNDHHSPSSPLLPSPSPL